MKNFWLDRKDDRMLSFADKESEAAFWSRGHAKNNACRWKRHEMWSGGGCSWHIADYPPDHWNIEDDAEQLLKNFWRWPGAQALTTQDIKFARLIERLQCRIKDGVWYWMELHLVQKGKSFEFCERLKNAIVKMPSANWREIAREEA